MKKKIIYCLIIFSVIILQTSVLPLFSPAYATGNILLMLILAGAIIDGFFAFIWWSVFAGIIYDLVSYTTVGINALIFLLVVYFVSFFSRRFSVELRGVGLVLSMSFVVVATLLSRSITALPAVWDSQMTNVYFKEIGSLELIGMQVAYNILLFFLCFVALRKIRKFFALD